MNGIIYCRVSSEEQVKGTSLDSQKEACAGYAAAKKIKILKTFVDEGESAKFADRTQLLELIDFCRLNKGKVDVLIVWKLDRFARNAGDHFNIKSMLMKYGVRIVSVTEPIDASPEGKLMETILAGFAQFDNDVRAMRTVQGMRRKIQEGLFPWKPPLGYRSSTINGEKKNEPDMPDQPLFGLLQKAWKEFVTGAYTKAEIRRLMASWGIATHKGKPISSQSLDKFFRNTYYAGILVDPWSGSEYEGRHIQMVTRQEFARVQEITNKRSRSIPHQKERPDFPLRGLVRCNHCQHYMTGSISRGRTRRYPYYHCGYRGCPKRGKSYPVEAINGEFEGFLSTIAPKAPLVEKLTEVIVLEANQQFAFAETKKVRLETEVLRLKREFDELIRMRAQSLITDDEFIAQKSALLERRHALESRAVHETVDEAEIRQNIAEITTPLTRLKHTWATLQDGQRRRFERLLLPVGFQNQKVRTAELGLLFQVFEEFSEGESTGVALVRKCWNQILAEIRAFSGLFKSEQRDEGDSERAIRRNPKE